MIKANFFVDAKRSTANHGVLELYPLERGFGQTMGNVLRRVMLSSLEGAAVNYVKIKGVSHPFSTIKGLKEDVLTLLMNIKLLRFKFEAAAEQKLVLKAKGPKKVTAALIDDSPLCKVINKDLYLCELAKDGVLEIEIYVNKGIGYVPSEEKEEREFGLMPLDSIYTPVTNVSLTVQPTRVGSKTNFDKLVLDVETDGSLTPKQVLDQAARILVNQFELLVKGGIEKPKKEESGLEQKDTDKEERPDMMVDELDLPTRVINALIKHGIETVERLKNLSDDELAQVRGLGKKSIEELKDRLKEL
jgi:DNA-directed RNA polymerase subunit alpha